MRKLDLRPIPHTDFDGKPVEANGEPSTLDPVDWISNRILGLDQTGRMTFGMIEKLLL